MFDLVAIILNNFRSYRGKHTFKFPIEPGLYSFTGKNLDNERLGANGAGKSTLLDAIYWVLYGRTTRGLKAGDVINWDEKSCSGTLTVLVGNEEATIKRSQAPNGLTLNGKTIAQEELQKFLRLAPDAFTHAVLIPQFGDAFFDLSASDKLTLFSKIMDLDQWLARSKAAALLASELATEQIRVEGKIGTYKALITELTAEINRVIEEADNFDNRKADRVAALKVALALVEKEQVQLKKSIQGDEQALGNIATRISNTTNKAPGRAQALLALQGRREANLTAQATLQARFRALRGQIKALSGLEGTCPTCLQQVGADHLKAEGKKLAKQGESISIELDEIADELAEIEEGGKALAKAAAIDTETIDGLQRNKRDFERLLADAKVAQARLTEKAGSLDAALIEEGTAINPYDSQITAKEGRLQTLKSKRKKLKAILETLREDHAAVSYWINGFKKLRLFIIDETLQQLEIEVNNNLTALGLLDWRVAFDVERENKSGGVTKGFVVMVYAPGHAEPVRFEAWSGGETQRLRLAGDLGLANLIMHRAGLTSAIEFYDEPSRHLSQEGQLDLAEALYQRAISSGKRIYLVDHNTIDFGDFAGRIVATKTDKGSSLAVLP